MFFVRCHDRFPQGSSAIFHLIAPNFHILSLRHVAVKQFWGDQQCEPTTTARISEALHCHELLAHMETAYYVTAAMIYIS